MSEDNITKNTGVEALKFFEKDRLQCIQELTEDSKVHLEQQIKQLEQETSEKLSEDIELQTTQLDSTIQMQFVEQLKAKADEIQARSKQLYKDGGLDMRADTRKMPECLFTIVYGHLSQQSANKIGIMLPAYKTRSGNGDAFLPERIKAVTLETILRNKDALSVKSISLVEDATLTVLCLDFESLTSEKSTQESGVCTAYDQTLEFDVMLDDAYSADPVLKKAKLKFEMIEGNVINYLVPHNLKIALAEEKPAGEDAKLDYRALAAGGYVSEADAIKYLFDLDRSSETYKSQIVLAGNRFRKEFGAGTFKHEFNNFQMKTVGRNRFYKQEELKKLKEGKKEAIKRGSEISEVLCRYMIPVADEKKMAEFFTFGVYTREDALIKFNIARQKIDKNKTGVVPVIEEHVLETPQGELVVYTTEELEGIA